MRASVFSCSGIFLLLLLDPSIGHAGQISLQMVPHTNYWLDAMGRTTNSADLVAKSLFHRSSK